jgi:hypothetical protein
MKTAVVTVNGQEHTITELKPRQNAEWRNKFQETFRPLLTHIESAFNVNLSDFQAMAKAINDYLPRFLGAADKVHELCVAYDPAFEEGYESEAVEAFSKVLELAFPFRPLLEQILNITNGSGSTVEAISPSLPEPSGDSGTTS